MLNFLQFKFKQSNKINQRFREDTNTQPTRINFLNIERTPINQ